MKLKKNYRTYTVNALGAVVQRVKEIVKAIDNPVIVAFLSSIEKYVKSLNRGFISAAEIAGSDDCRDACFRGLTHLANLYTESPNKDQAEVALQVSTIIDKQGGFDIPQMSYKEETSALKRVIAGIEELPAEKIDLIYLNDWLPLLKKQNDEFEKQIAEYIDNQVDYDETLSATEARRDLELKLKAVVEYIEAVLVVSPTDEIKRIHKELLEVFNR